MPKSKTSLNELLHEIRRIEEHREELTEKKIRKIYKQLLKNLNSFVSEYYVKYSDDDGRLTVAMLQEKAKYAKFLEEIEKNVNNLSPKVAAEITTTVKKTYEMCYEGMVKAVEKSKNGAELAENLKDLNVRPEIMKRAIENPVSGLTLPDTLEKNRKEVLYSIKQEINIGLMNGDRYDTVAKKLSEKLDMDYKKAVRIARTETHRVQEGGFFDCAMNISSGLEGSELIYAATWKTMKDERVRPQRAAYKRKAGVKARKKYTAGLRAYIGKGYANHMKMEGVTVEVGEYFDLGNGVKTKAPSQSGDAGNDINCRCRLSYDLMTVDEFAKATGRSVEKVLKKKNKISDLDMREVEDKQEFADAIKAAKKANPHGGAVDEHSIEELKEFKTFLSKNGMAGVAVKPDGDITAVFKNSEYKARGAVNDLIITARQNGGVKMDCYGKALVNKYEACGYVPVARVEFNADYVSDPWLLETKPDVYVLMKNTDDIQTVIRKNGSKSYKLSSQEELDGLKTFDYDEALNYRDELLKLQEG